MDSDNSDKANLSGTPNDTSTVFEKVFVPSKSICFNLYLYLPVKIN